MVHNNSLIYIQFPTGIIKGKEVAEIDGTSYKDLIPVQAYSFAISVVPSSTGSGATKDNTNKRYSVIRVFMPASNYIHFPDVVFTNQAAIKVNILTTSMIDGKVTMTYHLELSECYLHGLAAYNSAQFNDMSAKSLNYMLKEIEIMSNSQNKQVINLAWFEEDMFPETDAGLISPGLNDVCMIYISYTKVEMKAKVISNNIATGNVVTTITKT